MSARRAFQLSAVAAVLCLLAFAVLSAPIVFGSQKAFDQRLCCYTFEDAIQYLAWLDMEPDRWPAYARYRWIDAVFPLAVCGVLIASMRLLWTPGRIAQAGIATALLYLGADYAENWSLAQVMDAAGAVFSGADVQRAAAFTALKWAGTTIAVVLIFVGWRRRASDPRKGTV